LTGYYRRFIKDYAKLPLPLVQLKQKDSVFQWGEEQQKSFAALKQAVTQVSTGHIPFYLTHGYHPLCPATLHLGAAVNEAAHSMATKVQAAIKLTKEHIKRAQKRQKMYADRKRRDVEFEEGDRFRY